jgi:hypothetical protein
LIQPTYLDFTKKSTGWYRETLTNLFVVMVSFTATLVALLAASAAATVTVPPTRTYQPCGGMLISPRPCPRGHRCIDDPRIDGCGMACDRPGICVPYNAPTCAGFAGRRCRRGLGLQCFDFPDQCDPYNGGRDCGGICLYPLPWYQNFDTTPGHEAAPDAESEDADIGD